MTSSAPSESDQVVEFDPAFLNARREAIVIFLAWAAALVWCVPYCYAFGYGVEHDNVAMVWGIPSWLFWGICFPWILANAFTVWFCLCYMKLDNLTVAGDEADGALSESTPSAGDAVGNSDAASQGDAS